MKENYEYLIKEIPILREELGEKAKTDPYLSLLETRLATLKILLKKDKE